MFGAWSPVLLDFVGCLELGALFSVDVGAVFGAWSPTYTAPGPILHISGMNCQPNVSHRQVITYFKWLVFCKPLLIFRFFIVVKQKKSILCKIGVHERHLAFT